MNNKNSTISIEFYAATKINRKTICFLLLPIIFIIPLFMENEVIRRNLSGKVLPFVTIFNIAYVTLIALLTLLKDKRSVAK